MALTVTIIPTFEKSRYRFTYISFLVSAVQKLNNTQFAKSCSCFLLILLQEHLEVTLQQA